MVLQAEKDGVLIPGKSVVIEVSSSFRHFFSTTQGRSLTTLALLLLPPPPFFLGTQPTSGNTGIGLAMACTLRVSRFIVLHHFGSTGKGRREVDEEFEQRR